MNRKSLITFLIITFGLAWTLFCIPLAFKSAPQSTTYLAVWQVCFMAAMWAPGLGAIFATRLVEKQPVIKTLRLNTLGPKRFYFLAWCLPALLTLATMGVSNLLGTGAFDPKFTFMQESMTKAAAGIAMPGVEILVLGQVAFALTLAPFINLLFAIGEELGWRGFLLTRLMPLGQWKAILLSGLIWGIWHAPTTLLYGYNFPQHPYLGVLLLPAGFTLLGIILSWLTLKTRSPWVAGLGHGAFNAVAGLAFLLLKPGFDTALAGSPLGLAGWVPMAALVALLIWTKQLPVVELEAQPS
ncbi:MAG: CPBP family intramembrane metalloprotease [Chloroflexi bacterium]|nr:CPBP family intramembrane metalloprotease [Chloroflexota bacterium]